MGNQAIRDLLQTELYLVESALKHRLLKVEFELFTVWNEVSIEIESV